jgi:predicted secreted protein
MATKGHAVTLTGSIAGLIGEVRTVDISGRKRDMIDTSSADSTDSFRTFIAGMADEGELSVDVVYNGTSGATAHRLDSAFTSETVQTWTIAMYGGSSWACAGHISNLGTAVSYDKEITQSITIKMTGKGTFTPV